MTPEDGSPEVAERAGDESKAVLDHTHDRAAPRPVPIPVDKTEITESPRTDHAPAGLDGTPGSTALAAFLRFHPFMAFFCWLADAQYPASHYFAEMRVAKHREACPKLYWVCVVLDMLVTLVAVAGILVLAGAVAYKAVWK
jgi:hypothetical protein